MDDHEKLYPTCGKLFPDGLWRLAKCEDYDQVKGVADCCPVSFAGCMLLSLNIVRTPFSSSTLIRSMLQCLLVLALTQEKRRWRTSSLRKRWVLYNMPFADAYCVCTHV